MTEITLFFYFVYILEILSGTFLSFTAKNIGHRWKEFLTRLNFESHHFVHWETDNLQFSDEPIIIGLKEWIKIPMAKNLLSYRNIEEIKDWLVQVLESECERKDISHDIQEYYTGKLYRNRPKKYKVITP